MHLNFFDRCRGFFARFSPSKMAEYNAYKKDAEGNTTLKLSEFIKAKRIFQKAYDASSVTIKFENMKIVVIMSTDADEARESYNNTSFLYDAVNEHETTLKQTTKKVSSLATNKFSRDSGYPSEETLSEKTPFEDVWKDYIPSKMSHDAVQATIQTQESSEEIKQKSEELKKLETEKQNWVDTISNLFYQRFEAEIKLEQLKETQSKIPENSDYKDFSQEIKQEIKQQNENIKGLNNRIVFSYKKFKANEQRIINIKKEKLRPAPLEAFHRPTLDYFLKSPAQSKDRTQTCKADVEKAKSELGRMNKEGTDYKSQNEYVMRLEGKLKALETADTFLRERFPSK